MKNTHLAGFVTCIFMLCLTGVSDANTVIVGGSIDSLLTEVDYFAVNLDATGSLTVDVLAWEREEGKYGTNAALYDFFDNGEGNDTLDATIFLFGTDGRVIGSNIDYVGSYGDKDNKLGTYRDGSESAADPYLYFASLGAGDYTLAIGALQLTEDEARSGYNTDPELPDWDIVGSRYQITFESSANLTVAPVPEPATMVLFATGLAGLVGSRVRRRKET